jgi:membrane fusion protein (multidrug efflux system)
LREQAKVLLAKLGGDPNFTVSKHPAYEQAKAQVDEAQRQVDHTVIRAPFNSIVTQVDQLQPGVYLVASTAALTNTGAVALVATDDIWIEANVKETDLTWVKPGDSVEISVDSYPDRSWTGKVKSIAPASGAEFSVLPAQNTSDNWVKVVQRIPVRIAVERSTPAATGPLSNRTMVTSVPWWPPSCRRWTTPSPMWRFLICRVRFRPPPTRLRGC